MAVGLDLDTESLQRSSIPSGGAGTLSDGGFKNCFAGVWIYRPSATTTYALTAAGSFIHFQAGAREVVLGFNSAGANLSDLNLQIIFNSGGGAGTPATFSGHTGASFLDEWVYYFIADNPTDGQIAGYIRLADLATAVTQVRANDNAGSQFVNTLTFGNNSSNNAVAMGNYAFARAAYNTSTGYNTADALAFAASSAPSGMWGFWALPNNTGNADSSGNARDLTFNGTLTSESDPTLAGPPPSISAQPVNQRVPAGGTASFSVTASGGTLTYQWQSNATGSAVDIGGETASTYTTGALAAGAAYAVRVNVTDANGTTASAWADVWTPVAKPPAWSGLYGRAGTSRRASRDLVGANALLPTSDTTGPVFADALFGAAPLGGTPVTGAGGIASAEAFGTAALTRTSVQQVNGTGIASAEAFGTATVSRRAVVADAGGIASAEAFGTVTVTRLTGTTVSPSGIASAETFGAATLTRTSGRTVVPAGITSVEAFGTAAFSRLTGTTVAPAGIASAEAFGAATLTRTSVQQVTGAGIASAEAFGTALLTRISTRTVTGAGSVASAEAFGTPVFTRAAVQQIVVPGIVSAEAFGTAALTARRAFTPTSIASAEAFGTATLTRDGAAPAARSRLARMAIRIGISL